MIIGGGTGKKIKKYELRDCILYKSTKKVKLLKGNHDHCSGGEQRKGWGLDNVFALGN